MTQSGHRAIVQSLVHPMRFADHKPRCIGAVIPLQRLNLLRGDRFHGEDIDLYMKGQNFEIVICLSLFALCRWNQMPLGAFRHHVRVVVAASICLGVAATTRPSQKYNRATV